MRHAQHIAATISPQGIKVHGTLRHDTGAVRSSASIYGHNSRVGDAGTIGRCSQVAIYTLFVTLIGGDVHQHVLYLRGTAIGCVEVLNIDRAEGVGWVVQREILVEVTPGAPFGTVPCLIDR